MSKSQGNLVFVSALRNSDVDPMAIRLVLLRHHYRSDWEWLDAELWDAVDTLGRLAPRARRWAPVPRPRRWSPRCWPRWPTTSTPRARSPPCRRWVDATLGSTGHLADTTDPDAALTMHALLDAALGLAL